MDDDGTTTRQRLRQKFKQEVAAKYAGVVNHRDARTAAITATVIPSPRRQAATSGGGPAALGDALMIPPLRTTTEGSTVTPVVFNSFGQPVNYQRQVVDGSGPLMTRLVNGDWYTMAGGCVGDVVPRPIGKAFRCKAPPIPPEPHYDDGVGVSDLRHRVAERIGACKGDNCAIYVKPLIDAIDSGKHEHRRRHDVAAAAEHRDRPHGDGDQHDVTGDGVVHSRTRRKTPHRCRLHSRHVTDVNAASTARPPSPSHGDHKNALVQTKVTQASAATMVKPHRGFHDGTAASESKKRLAADQRVVSALAKADRESYRTGGTRRPPVIVHAGFADPFANALQSSRSRAHPAAAGVRPSTARTIPGGAPPPQSGRRPISSSGAADCAVIGASELASYERLVRTGPVPSAVAPASQRPSAAAPFRGKKPQDTENLIS